MEQTNTFIIIPAYNENPEVLFNVISNFQRFKVIVVDDGSLIPVKVSLKNYRLKDNVMIVEHAFNQGQGSAIETGVKLAIDLHGEIFCSVDGDGQHDFESCFEIINEFSLGQFDIILGSRFLNKNSNIPLLKKFFLKGGILINYLYSGIILHDAHCGLRVFGKDFANNVTFYNKRQAHASEILWIIKKNNFLFKEFPVKVIYSPYSLSKGQSVWNSFNILFDLLKHRLVRNKL